MVARQLFAVVCMCSVLVPATAAQQSAAERAQDRHLAGHSALRRSLRRRARASGRRRWTGIGVTPFPDHDEEPRSADVVRPGPHAAALVLVSTRPSARSGGRRSSIPTRRCRTGAWRASVGGGARASAFMKEASRRKAQRQRARARLHRGVGVRSLDDDVRGAADGPRRRFTQGARAHRHEVPGRHRGQGDARPRDDGREPRRHRHADAAGARGGSEASRRASLPHPQLGRRGRRARRSTAAAPTATIAPGIGHALHMPGHIYAGVGMFHESAISLDSATRAEIALHGPADGVPVQHVELRAQPQLSELRAGAARAAGRSDPRRARAAGGAARSEGQRRRPVRRRTGRACRRCRARWSSTSAGTRSSRTDRSRGATSLRDKLGRRYAEAHGAPRQEAIARRRRRRSTTHAALKAEVEKQPSTHRSSASSRCRTSSCAARSRCSRARPSRGSTLLTQAAPKELEQRADYDDPPFYPTLMWSKIGYAYLDAASPKLAVDAFSSALEGRAERSVRARRPRAGAATRSATSKAAADALGRLEFVWSDAEAGHLRWLTRRTRDRAQGRADRSLARARSATTARRRSTSSARPSGRRLRRRRSSVTDAAGQAGDARSVPRQERDPRLLPRRRLSRTASSSSRICPSAPSEWARLDTEVIAVSQDTPRAEREVAGDAPLKMRLGSDAGFENAQRFKSYDDFEEMGIHSTILIDKDGRVHWAKHGGAPFDDFKFLTSSCSA